MRLTKKKALEICIELWSWLAETGCKHKCDWTEWINNGGKTPWMLNNCSLCEYSKQDMRGCTNCPLEKELNQCKPYVSVYAKWCNSNWRFTRKRHARKIRDHAIEALKKL